MAGTDQPPKLPARDLAYREVKRAILEGYYRPSAHLVEQAIADRLRISKTPLREALTRLEQEGLVQSYPHRGFFVREFSARDVREVYELREIYERACAAVAAASENHMDLGDELESVNDHAREALSEGRIDDVHRYFARYDELIFGQSDNRLLQEEIDRIRARIHLSGVTTNRIPGRIEKSLREHQTIIDAIRAGDVAAAESSTREHIRSLMEDELNERERSSESWRHIG